MHTEKEKIRHTMHTKRHFDFTAPHLLPPDYDPLLTPHPLHVGCRCSHVASTTYTSAPSSSLLHSFAEPIHSARTLVHKDLETCHTQTRGPNRNQHRAMRYKLAITRGVVTDRRRKANWSDTFKPRTEMWTRVRWCGTHVWSCRGGREGTRCGYQTTRGYSLNFTELGGHKMVV
jgi:hypothetical protein